MANPDIVQESKKILLLIVLAISMIVSGTAAAQQAPGDQSEELKMLRDMLKEDRSTADALVLYPDDVRNAIFRVSMYPELLAKVAAIQQKSNAAFGKSISSLPLQAKKDIWAIVRFPGLVKKLIDCGQAEEKVQKLAVEYEAPVREAILRAGTGKTESEVLMKIEVLDRSVQEALQIVEKKYPIEIQESLETLIQVPDTLSLLSENMPLTVLVGEVYKQDPAFAEQRASEVGQEVRLKNIHGIEDWKKQLEVTPQAFRELEKAVRVLAAERGYDPARVLTAVSEQETAMEIRPYPYWYGYPKWHPESYWYPYRYWHYCGFFYSTDGNIVVIGTPSAEYLRWHFQDDRHLNQYPHLTDQLLRYYENHGDFSHTFNAIVGRWVEENRERVPGDWLRPDAERVSRLRKNARVNQISLTEQAESMSLNVNPLPPGAVDDASKALKLTLPAAFQWQSQAEEYHEARWDSTVRRQYYESRIP